MEQNRQEIETWRRAIGCLFAGAMVVAPFIALLYDLNAGLLLMAFGLLATAFLAYDAMSAAHPAVRVRLRTVVIVNLALAALLLVVVVVRIG
ncbi:MAG: hypothetical protein ACJ789_02375 [Thermomicrobiales bacterium]